MALKIRLARHGSKKRPYYRIVIADARAPRDGRYIERIGSYNPLLAKTDENRVIVDADKVKEWLTKGARPTERVARFLGAAGLWEWKHGNNPIKGKPGAKALELIEARKGKEEARAAAEIEAKEAAKEAAAAAKVAAAEALEAEKTAAAEAKEAAQEATKEATKEEAKEAPAEEAPAADSKEEKPEDKSEDKSEDKLGAL
ncbi:MAG: 30S ribosomal protein S16 [Robiginitomaculum sp.]|nr:30S ribosomal protein S16 [Robiginitomaculum sp.]